MAQEAYILFYRRVRQEALIVCLASICRCDVDTPITHTTVSLFPLSPFFSQTTPSSFLATPGPKPAPPTAVTKPASAVPAAASTAAAAAPKAVPKVRTDEFGMSSVQAAESTDDEADSDSDSDTAMPAAAAPASQVKSKPQSQSQPQLNGTVPVAATSTSNAKSKSKSTVENGAAVTAANGSAAKTPATKLSYNPYQPVTCSTWAWEVTYRGEHVVLDTAAVVSRWGAAAAEEAGK